MGLQTLLFFLFGAFEVLGRVPFSVKLKITQLLVGPVVLVGLGGVFVEIFEEVSLRVAPISRREALTMIEDLRGAPILMGARGHKRSDIKAVVDVILRLSRLLCDFPEIQELDINPLRVFHEPDGCQALDARIIL